MDAVGLKWHFACAPAPDHRHMPPDSDHRRKAAMEALCHTAGGEAIAPNRPNRPIPEQLSRDFRSGVRPNMPGLGGCRSKEVARQLRYVIGANRSSDIGWARDIPIASE